MITRGMSPWRRPVAARGTVRDLALVLLAVATTACAEQSGIGEPIELRVLVDADPDEVVLDWTDQEMVNAFLGVTSRIEARPGGAYEIGFLPATSEEASDNATVGARILALDSTHLAFEWRVPPWAEEPVGSAPPTRVDLRVRAASEHPAAGQGAIVHLRHSGFGQGEAWDEVRAFFQWAWHDILQRYVELKARDG